MKLLHIKVSQNLEGSASRKASHHLVEKLKTKYPELEETILDLSVNPLPHLNSLTISAFFTSHDARSNEQIEAVRLSDKMVDMLFDHDVIIVSSPMWNLGLPSVLKAWFDHVTRAGRTFAFTGIGTKVGLIKNKKVYGIVASGSLFSEGPFINDDQFSPYFKVALNYIGIDDVEIVRVEGTHDPRTSATALSTALKNIDQLKF